VATIYPNTNHKNTTLEGGGVTTGEADLRRHLDLGVCSYCNALKFFA